MRPSAADLWLARLQTVAVAVSAVLVVVLLAPLPAQVRLAVAALFVMFGPGTAVLTLTGARFADVAPVGLAIALGMAVTVILAQLIMLLGVFSPRPELIGAAVAVIAVVTGTWWRQRRAAAARSADRDAADGVVADGRGLGDNEPPMSVGERG